MVPEILYEDNHIIVINKPFGILSQGDSSGDLSLLEILKDYIKKKYNKSGEVFLGLVHRLDKPVTGVMVYARTSKAASRLYTEIVSSRFEKYYIAAVEKNLLPDSKWYRIINFLKRDRDKTVISTRGGEGTQNGELVFRTIVSSERYSLILVKLITGRKHQIRAQLSYIGAPIAGDKKYGADTDLKGQIALHSTFLSFQHPTLKEKMEFYSPPPELFSNLLYFENQNIRKHITELIKELRDQAVASK